MCAKGGSDREERKGFDEHREGVCEGVAWENKKGVENETMVWCECDKQDSRKRTTDEEEVEPKAGLQRPMGTTLYFNPVQTPQQRFLAAQAHGGWAGLVSAGGRTNAP